MNTKDASIGHLESVKITLKNLVTRKNTLKSIGVGSKNAPYAKVNEPIKS